MHETKDKIEPQYVQFIYMYAFKIDFVGKPYACKISGYSKKKKKNVQRAKVKLLEKSLFFCDSKLLAV